jgi:hypothetical protein
VASSKEIIQKADKYTHSNRLVERKVEQKTIKAAALMPAVAPGSV